jgi:hypothetical protein
MDTLIPPVMRQLLADPPLVRGEDAADYQRMVGELGAESGATGVVDWMLVKDIADLTWQIARTRRFVSAYTVSAERVGLALAIQQVTGEGTKYVWDKTLARVDAELDAPGTDGGACQAVLAKCGVPAAQLGIAHAFFHNLDALTAAERLLTRLERRRHRALAQIEGRRAAFGKALREAAHRVVDAEVVPPAPPPQPATAWG